MSTGERDENELIIGLGYSSANSLVNLFVFRVGWEY